MAHIKIVSTRESVAVVVDGKDITNMVLSDPRPIVEVASAENVGQSTVTLTLMGEVDVEFDGELVEQVST